MMSYEIFKGVVAEKFMDYMPEKYQGMKIEIRSVDKVNATLDVMNLVGEDDIVISPTIRIADMYEWYQNTGDLQETVRKAALKMAHDMEEAPEVLTEIDFSNAKDNIVFELVNTEQNKEMLQNMPNRAFQDLSIIYRWVIKNDENNIHSTIIDNSLVERLGLSEEQMFELAVENTRRIFPPIVSSMNDIIRDMYMKSGMPEEIADMMIGEISSEKTMWVITNKRNFNGAVSMLYEDELYELAQQLENDLYIMPSSVNEVIAISASMAEPNELAKMVAEINMEQVPLDERLSNQVYYYDKDLRKLSLATDTPNKRLDGIVAEKEPVYNVKRSSKARR